MEDGIICCSGWGLCDEVEKVVCEVGGVCELKECEVVVRVGLNDVMKV